MYTYDVCLLYSKYSESRLQLLIFLYIWWRQDTEKYGSVQQETDALYGPFKSSTFVRGE